MHSVFDRVINVMLGTPMGERMLSLTTEELPAVPDSLCFPAGGLPALEIGEGFLLKEDCVIYLEGGCRLESDRHWCGKIRIDSGLPDEDGFLSATERIPSGFARLPEKARQRAIHALCHEEWQSCLGLGYGLTPSFDDACVGWMAYRQAQGRGFPELKELSVTTDVSARYLGLAQEGYFGDLLLELTEAIWGKRPLREAISRLKEVGATSGCDMMEGVRYAILKDRQQRQFSIQGKT